MTSYYIQDRLSDSIIENVNVWLNVLDQDLNIVLWNATAERLSGYQRSEVQGHNQVWTWLYPDEKYRKQITAETQSMLTVDQGMENFETTILCKNGQYRTMSWNAQRWRGDDGRLLGAICFGYDITERRRAREALQTAHSELSVLYQIASLASSSTELKQILASSLEIVLSTMQSNKGIVHLIGEDGESLRLVAHTGLLHSDIQQIESLPLDSELMGSVVERGEPIMLPNLATELENLKSVPANLLHSYLGAPMRAKGKVVGVFSILGKGGQAFSGQEIALLSSIADQVGVVVENTRLNQQSQQLAIIEERQRLARDLHDSLTQSLYSLILFAETGVRLVNAGDLTTTERYLSQMSETAQGAMKEMRQLVHELRPLGLEEEGLVQTIQTRLDAVERRAGIKAHLLADALIDLPLPLTKELYYIVLEALNNSLKYAEAASVTVTIQLLESSQRPPSRGQAKSLPYNHLLVEVSDDGCGFDTMGGERGQGMGLISMRERVEKLNGLFTIDSSAARGTTVHVCIPMLD